MSENPRAAFARLQRQRLDYQPLRPFVPGLVLHDGKGYAIGGDGKVFQLRPGPRVRDPALIDIIQRKALAGMAARQRAEGASHADEEGQEQADDPRERPRDGA